MDYQCFVDTVGPADAYKEKLSAEFPTLTFVVCSKADSIYAIVSAASIAAKVTRDKVMESWSFMEQGWEGETNFGSGYPSGSSCSSEICGDPLMRQTDPKTVAWLEENVDPVFGFPNIARFSWQTVKTILMKRAVKVKWCVPSRTLSSELTLRDRDDEPATIQKYFSGAPAGPAKAALWKDYSLVSVAGF